MIIKNKTECVQASEPKVNERGTALLWVLACISSVFFACVRWLHVAWQMHSQHGGCKVDGADAGAQEEVKEKKKCRRVHKSGAEMAIEAAEKALQGAENTDEHGAVGQAAAKKARKAATDALAAARTAKKAIDDDAKQKSTATNRNVIKRDEDAKKAANRALGAAKRAESVVERAKGDSDGGNEKDGNKTSGGSHIDQVLYALAGGMCHDMAKNFLSSLKFKFSNGSKAKYGLDDMYRVLLAVCMGDGKTRSIDGQCSRRRKDSNCKVPSRQWVFDMINGVRRDFMVTRCRHMLYRSVLQARRRGMLREAVDVSIDMHDVPCYTKILRLYYAVKSKYKNGTSTFNRLITIHCVTSGQRLTLGVDVIQQ